MMPEIRGPDELGHHHLRCAQILEAQGDRSRREADAGVVAKDIWRKHSAAPSVTTSFPKKGPDARRKLDHAMRHVGEVLR